MQIQFTGVSEVIKVMYLVLRLQEDAIPPRQDYGNGKPQTRANGMK